MLSNWTVFVFLVLLFLLLTYIFAENLIFLFLIFKTCFLIISGLFLFLYIMHFIKTGQLQIDLIWVVYGSVPIIGGIFGLIMFDGPDESIYSKQNYLKGFLFWYVYLVISLLILTVLHYTELFNFS